MHSEALKWLVVNGGMLSIRFRVATTFNGGKTTRARTSSLMYCPSNFGGIGCHTIHNSQRIY